MAKAATADARRRRDRGSITADQILNGAFEVAAQVSIDNLSMPQLAKHLEVGVTSIYWYFRKKEDLLNTMTDSALDRYAFTAASIDASNWRESLRNHARTMRQEFRSNPILCDLILIRSRYGRRAAHDALQKVEQPVAALVEAGLTPEHAFDTYAAIAVHIRGSVVLERLQEKKIEDFVPRSGTRIRGIGFADDTDFDYILDSILDHAESLLTLSRASP